MYSQELFLFLPSVPHREKFVNTKSKLALYSIYIFMAKKQRKSYIFFITFS